MYGVFIPSKIKPLKTFNCLRSADQFAKSGLSRCIFDMSTGVSVNAGTIPRTLKDFFLDHNNFVLSNKVDVMLHKFEKGNLK